MPWHDIDDFSNLVSIEGIQVVTIGIYQTSLSGHHGAYARAISLAAQELGWKIRMVVPDGCRTHPMAAAIAAVVGESNMFYSPFKNTGYTGSNHLSLLRYQVKQHKLASQSIQLIKKGCDFVYIPTLDLMDQAIRVLGLPCPNMPMAGMCMRIRFHLRDQVAGDLWGRTIRNAGEASLRTLVSFRGLKCLTTADPLLAEYVLKSRTLIGKIRYVPEIGMDRSSMSRGDARNRLAIQEDEKVILVFGQITRRKGIVELLKAIDATTFKVHVRILVVGESDAEMKAFFSDGVAQRRISSGQLQIIEGFADDLVEAAAFAAADAVWVAYVGHYTMSGVFYQAVCNSLPVIVTNFGVMSKIAASHLVGPSVDIFDPKSTGSALKRLLENASSLESFGRNTVALAESHRPIQFGRGVCEAIASC